MERNVRRDLRQPIKLFSFISAWMIWPLAIFSGAIVALSDVSQYGAIENYKCPPPEKPPSVDRKAVYKGMPFQPGELAKYDVSYGGVHAGYGTIGVRPPTKHEGIWHRVFHGEARTGDWFKTVFILHDEIEALSRPWDFGAAKFYIKQNEGTMLGKKYVRTKWLEFGHNHCQVRERVERLNKPATEESFTLMRGANDSMAAYFHLRTLNYKVGKVEKILVYTSKKNWLLEANPVSEEQLAVPAGKFAAIKIKLQTYLGDELSQKGDVFLWIAKDLPQKPMLQVQAEVKVGNIWIKLAEFTPGTAL